jgi:hypothetical protein
MKDLVIPLKASLRPCGAEAYISAIQGAIKLLADCSLSIDRIVEEIAVERGVRIVLRDIILKDVLTEIQQPASPTPICRRDRQA